MESDASAIARPMATMGAESTAPNDVRSSAIVPTAAHVARTVRTDPSGSAAGAEGDRRRAMPGESQGGGFGDREAIVTSPRDDDDDPRAERAARRVGERPAREPSRARASPNAARVERTRDTAKRAAVAIPARDRLGRADSGRRTTFGEMAPKLTWRAQERRSPTRAHSTRV